MHKVSWYSMVFHDHLWIFMVQSVTHHSCNKVQLPTSLSRHQQRGVAQVRCPVDVSSCDHGTPRMCCSLSVECWNMLEYYPNYDEFSLAHFDLRIGESG
jgi:hypothetical protein